MLPRPSRVLVTNPDRQLPCHFSKTVLRIPSTVQPSLFLLKFPSVQQHEGFPGIAHRHQHPGEQVEFRQATAGTGREDRGKFLFPRPDLGSTAAPVKRKAGGNKNLRQGDSSSHPADGRRRTQRVDESLVRLTFLPFMQRKAGCAHLAQKDLIFGKCATGMQKVCSHFPT